ncbi:two-component system sensor histidine kinase CreC [Luteimonas cucumeris]|uniref:histidine kinase n=1 Tax=Luteimonas cucumeris TaxID=985012 RepID=A0A562L716_9GAMM|nr:two-component system sensor histidine kinase CreC [Luteimonas cucumeris]TWI03421.1 two-component system sensor histidine kinase CreC [Luteimonas cucumeris]
MKLGLRLFLGFFLIVGVAAFFVMRVFVDEVKPGVRQAMEANLADTANVLAALAAADMKAGRIADGAFARDIAAAERRRLGADIWGTRKDRLDYRILVTDARGIVVYDSQDEAVGKDYSRWNDVYRTLRGQYGARSSGEVPGDRKNTVMHVAAPILDVDDEDRIIGVLTVAKANRTMEPVIARSQRNILRGGGWLLGLSALIGLVMTWWLVRGIGRLNRYAQAVSSGERVPPPPPRRDEIGDLGRALETMRRELEGKQYVEQYVQTLTHEMKSPLAAIRAAAELLQEPLPEAERARFAANVQGQSERLNEMIEKLLALAAVEHRNGLDQRERIDVSELVDEAVEALRPRLLQGEVDVSVSAPARPVVVVGDRFLLRQALRNLLDNAIDFAPRGSGIEVRWSRDERDAVLQVGDRGPGVPEFAQERVFERFYSLPRPNGGRSTGLGLTFVREVAGLHGGNVRLVPREGGGAQAELRLPAV